MIFSLTFEIGLLVIGFLYVCNMWFDSILHLIEIGNEIDEKEKEKQEDEARIELTKHLYS